MDAEVFLTAAVPGLGKRARAQDSKLCNVLFAQELQRRLAARGSGVTVNAFGPGLITRTGFFRNQQPLFVRVFDFATNELFHVAETVDGGGDCLV